MKISTKITQVIGSICAIDHPFLQNHDDGMLKANWVILLSPHLLGSYLGTWGAVGTGQLSECGISRIAVGRFGYFTVYIFHYGTASIGGVKLK